MKSLFYRWLFGKRNDRMEKWKKKWRQFLGLFAAVVFWIGIWFLLAEKIDQAIFLPKPAAVYRAVVRLACTRDFWSTVGASFLRILKGFLSAVIAGCLLAAFSYFFSVIKCLTAPAIQLMKAVPVASFTILALLWVDSDRLAELVAFIIVLPVIYINLLKGFESVPGELLEMAKVFDVPLFRRIRFLYIPAVFPAFTAACTIGLGFCFKAGIAAEVIGKPPHSIGGKLYEAKLYLMTDELFAWTAVIVVLSMILERFCIYILKWFDRRIPRVSRIRKTVHGRKEDGESAGAAVYAGAEIASGEKDREGAASFAGEKKYISTETKGDTETGIVLKNICKNYDGKQVLNKLSLSLFPGDRVCLMGASGIGKTTVLRILMGLTKKDAGELEGTDDVTMAVVFQEDRLLEETDVYSNLYFGCGGRKKARGASRTFDIDSVDRDLAGLGLAGMGSKPVRELSGGMKRRVALLRAIMKEPDLLLLDEPFNGMDADTRQLAVDYIEQHCKGKTILMVTHHSAEAVLLQAKEVWIQEGRASARVQGKVDCE